MAVRSRSVSRTRRLAVPLGALALAGAPVAALTAPAAHAVPSLPDSGYHRRVLQVPDGSVGYGLAINEHGWVAGRITTADDTTLPAVWDAAGTLHLLPTPGATGGQALGLDDRGRVVGSLTLTSGRAQAVVWRDGGAPRFAGPQDDDSLATLINRSGQVAGITRPEHSIPFLWAPARSGQPIVPRGGTAYPVGWTADHLDDAGNLYTDAFYHWPGMDDPAPATVWRLTPAGHEVDVLTGARRLGIVAESVWSVTASEAGSVGVTLQTRATPAQIVWLVVPSGRDPVVLGRAPDLGASGRRVVVNDRGLAVGADARSAPACAVGGSVAFRMVAWDAASGLRELPSSGAACGEQPLAVDDAGEVVGALADTSSTIFVWDAVRGYRVLSGAIWVAGMNQAGSVLGAVDGGSGRWVSAVWDPPEGQASTATTAAADTWISPASTRGFGAARSLTAGGGAQALLRFAVPAPPAGRRLVAASVGFTVTTESGAGTALPLEVRPVTGAWTEASTWASRPAVDKRRLGWLGAVAAGEPASVRIDPAQVPGGGLLDVAVVGTSSDVVKLASREAAVTSARPSLELIYR